MPKKNVAIFIFLLTAAAALWLPGLHRYLKFEELIENRGMIISYVERHYIPSVLLYCLVNVSTAFFVPGTLILTVAGGFFFGFVPGTLYSLMGSSIGAFLAFLTSRFLIGAWIQNKFIHQLSGFNREIARHGINYLLAFRIFPVLPFFVVNYLAGIAHISTWTFIWTTFLGMLPGTLVCTFAGRQLGVITSQDEIFSTEVIVSLALLALLILLPPVAYHIKSMKNSR
jgi:uncharacterized membrane protein YdjX (TVP38/TMEM64 family)